LYLLSLNAIIFIVERRVIDFDHLTFSASLYLFYLVMQLFELVPGTVRIQLATINVITTRPITSSSAEDKELLHLFVVADCHGPSWFRPPASLGHSAPLLRIQLEQHYVVEAAA